MTVRQIIAEIEALPQAEQDELLHYFQKREAESQVQYVDPAKAKLISERIMTEHAGLFRKLAE